MIFYRETNNYLQQMASEETTDPAAVVMAVSALSLIFNNSLETNKMPV